MGQTLGKRIAENRKRLKLTQDLLAEKLGVTAQAVSKWENDLSCPDIATLPKLAEIFGITTDELLGLSHSETVHEAEVVDEEASENNGIHFQKDNWEFRWDTGKKGSIGFAALVLCIGVLYLLNHILTWGLSLWDILWPTTILIFGIFGLCKKLSFFMIGCILFGGYMLASKIFHLSNPLDKNLIWAVLILLFGLGLLADALKKPKKPKFYINIPDKASNARNDKYCKFQDTFTYKSSFNESQKLIEMETLRHGDINVSFGECTIDLSQIESLTEDCTIDAKCSFGELRFLVPKRFYVSVEHNTSFANIETRGTPDDHPVGKIHLDGNVSFGEIEIQYI